MSFGFLDQAVTGRHARVAGCLAGCLVMRLASLYKARGMSVRQPVCAICVDRTRGRTQQLQLRYGVSVWLSAGHASPEFTRRNNGRDLVLTLSRLCKAHGCLTAARDKALGAHLAALKGPPPRPRP